jgi:predicted DNA-binding protein
MAIYTRRIQAVLTAEQYEMLRELAEKSGQPVSLLVREAVEKVYFEKMDLDRRKAALDHLLGLDAPVGTWPEMEEEIQRGAVE